MTQVEETGAFLDSRPYIFVGSASVDSTNHGSEIYIFLNYVLANEYHVVRPTIDVSVMNPYGFFSLSFFI